MKGVFVYKMGLLLIEGKAGYKLRFNQEKQEYEQLEG